MFITPNWPAKTNVKAFTTLRKGGVSQKPFDEFNLAEHVGDHPEHVKTNRDILKRELGIPNEPIWINQIHGIKAIKAIPENTNQDADASYTNSCNQVCVILTADCLPILLCDKAGKHVAAIHAGWRGLAHGIIESTLTALDLPSSEILVWLGPAISATNYEVGDEVRQEFLTRYPGSEFAFRPSPTKRWLADLYGLARYCFLKQGISTIYGGEYCTFGEKERLYSYRRDGAKTGRMASLIWISGGD